MKHWNFYGGEGGEARSRKPRQPGWPGLIWRGPNKVTWREFCALRNIFILRFVVINSIKLLSFVCLVVVQERVMVTTSLMWVHVPRHWSGSPKIPRKFWLPKREARFLKKSAASWEMDICACTRTWTWPCTNKSRESHVHGLEHSLYHLHRTSRSPTL